MDKRILLVSALLVLSVASVSAYRGYTATRYQDMENIFEKGTYSDLVAYRAETGYPVMPWVTDEESFAVAKQHFELMDEYRKNNLSRGYGCPMRGW